MRYIAGVSTLRLDKQLCTGCGTCAVVCPHRVPVMVAGRAALSDVDRCMECGACARNCPAGAVTVRHGVGCAQAVLQETFGLESGVCCDTGPDGAPCCPAD